MTEAEWLHGSDLEGMLTHLSYKVSERKFRLTECAFLRRFWHLLSDVRNRKAVEVAERYADGLASKDELSEAYADAEAAFDEILGIHFPDRKPSRSYWGGAVSAAQHTAYSMYDTFESFPNVGADNPKRFGNMWNLVWYGTPAYPIGDDSSDAVGSHAIEAEQAAECVLLRDLFGNPFRPASLDPSSLTPVVVSLARTIYNERAFTRMSELADALEKSDCKKDEILQHCRESGATRSWLLGG